MAELENLEDPENPEELENLGEVRDLDRPGFRTRKVIYTKSDSSISNSPNYNKYVPLDFCMPNKNLNWKMGHFIDIERITQMCKLESQIDCLADVIDWDIVSAKPLSSKVYIPHKDRINWSTFLKGPGPVDPENLDKVKDKLAESQYLFFKPSMKKRYYTKEFISTVPHLVDWKWVIKHIQLGDDLIKFWDRCKINHICKYQKLTINVVKKKYPQINWYIASNKPLEHSIVEIASDYVYWPAVCRKTRNIPERILEENKHRIDWESTSRYQNLSGEFIKKYKSRLNMRKVSLYQNLDVATIRELQHNLDFEMLLKNTHYNKKNTLRVLFSDGMYFLIEPPIIGNMLKVNYLTLQEENL